MRTQAEMMDLILGFAREDERVLAVVLNGSRASPAAQRDRFQDYDIVYVVSHMDSFTMDHSWVDIFGPRILLQMPETMRGPVGDGRFSYLMLFEDTNRLDLTLIPADRPHLLGGDSQSILLLDKTGALGPFPPASDRDYWVPRPTALDYDSCCNNFLWCSQNVAKGLARDELPYAMGMLDILRAELLDMLGWYAGVQWGFEVTAGKLGKYLGRHLPPEMYQGLLDSWPPARADAVWQALRAMAELFRRAGRGVGQALGCAYPEGDHAAMMAYLEAVERA